MEQSTYWIFLIIYKEELLKEIIKKKSRMKKYRDLTHLHLNLL